MGLSANSANSANMCINDRRYLYLLVFMSNIYVGTYVQNSSRTFVKRVSRALSSAARRRRGERRRRRRFRQPSAARVPTATPPTLSRPDFTGSRIFRRRSSSFADARPVDYRAKLYIIYTICLYISYTNKYKQYSREI